MKKFSRQTFHYFEEAQMHPRSRTWFNRNEDLYQEEVRAPFVQLLRELEEKTAEWFPGFVFHHSKITRPLYREENEDGHIVRNFSWAFLSEKRTSIFEWNPGISISLNADGGKIGAGLYYPSSRQMAHLRESIVSSPAVAEKILKDRRLRTIWGDLTGERYLRFPRGYDAEAPGADLLWQKQFIFEQELSRREIMSPDLPERIARDLRVTAGFLDWMRKTVGVYEKNTAA